MFSSKVVVPSQGSAIEIDANGKLIVPDNPVVPFIRGDGIGADITPVMQKVVDAAVAKAYNQKKKISWMEIYAGGRSVEVYGAVRSRELKEFGIVDEPCFRIF